MAISDSYVDQDQEYTPPPPESSQQVAQDKKEADSLSGSIGQENEASIANAAGINNAEAINAANKMIQNPNDKDAQRDFVNSIENNITNLQLEHKEGVTNAETPEFKEAIKALGGDKMLKEIDDRMKDKDINAFDKKFSDDLLKGFEHLKDKVAGGTDVTSPPAAANTPVVQQEQSKGPSK